MQYLNRQQALEMRQGPSSQNFRKARTRTLIQLGGLIEKSGLLDLLDIEAGQDLQKDPDTLDAAATLMGALLSLQETLHLEEAETQKMLWRLQGKKALGQS